VEGAGVFRIVHARILRPRAAADKAGC
jgi:hypothetical protein